MKQLSLGVVRSLVLPCVALLALGCAGPTQNVRASLVTLIVKVPGQAPPPAGSTAAAPASRALPFHLGWADKERDGYGYEFNDDPLAAGSCRAGPCPPAATPTCERWSDCEVSKILNLQKDTFGPCLARAMELGPRVRTVAFLAKATVKETGAVGSVELTDVDPPDERVIGCVQTAFREVTFLIDPDGTTTNLTVPVRVMPELMGSRTVNPGKGPTAMVARRPFR